MALNFKLTQDNGLTRRVGFSEQPDWFSLATKIELLFNIPASNVAVSYLDSDGDQVTLSTPEELQDYYATLYVPGELIKFAVKDLAALRNKFALNVDSYAIPRTPPTSMSVPPAHSDGPSFTADLFEKFNGPQAFPDITEEDWQDVQFNFNPLNQIFQSAPPRPSTPPHIEVVDTSSASLASKIHSQFSDPDETRSQVSSVLGTFTAEEKGKGRSPFAATVEEEDSPVLSPVHVVDTTPRQAHPDLNERFDEGDPKQLPSGPPDTHDALAAVSTLTKEDIPDISSRIEDPHPIVGPSLVHDISSFVDNLTVAFASHPELSEGLRNIVRNLGDGQYWSNEREQFMNRTRETVDTLSAEGRNIATSVNAAVAEDQAGMRIARVIGGIFGALSEALGTLGGASIETTVPVVHNGEQDGTPEDQPPNAAYLPPTTAVTGTQALLPDNSQSSIVAYEEPVATTVTSPLTPTTRPKSMFQTPSAVPQSWGGPELTERDDLNLVIGIADIPAMDAHAQAVESRARLESAKAKYKEEKELFRTAKEKFRLEKENIEKRKAAMKLGDATNATTERTIDSPFITHSATAVPQTAHQFTEPRGAGSSTVEAIIARSNTWSGGVGPRHRHRVDHVNSMSTLKEAATFQSILQRLDDMGFNDTTNTGLRQLVEYHISSQGSKAFRVTKEREDQIIANILDDLINSTSGPSRIAGADVTMPGEW